MKLNAIKKVIFIIFLLNLIIFFNSEVNAETYGKDYFGEEYSNGYIRNCSSADVIRTSSGISSKTGRQINSNTWDVFKNMLFYSSNNTSKSEYVDYSKAARYINSNGESIWLDMRVYIWTNNRNYSWALHTTQFNITNLYRTAIHHTTMEFHFYTVGYCGNSNYEHDFKGVTKFNDLDAGEGFSCYSGYNKFYTQSGIPIVSVFPGNSNSTHRNNPFSTSGIATYPYFFGTRDNNSTDGVWVEIDSSPNVPFICTYGTRNVAVGMNMYYIGTPIEYYVDGILKDTYYCVPYGRYKLINPDKNNWVKTGYTIDGWYTNTNYNVKAQDGIAGESTIRFYGRYISNYIVKYNGNGATSGSTTDSFHIYNQSKNLTPNGFKKEYTVTYNHNYKDSKNVEKVAICKFKNWNTNSNGTGNQYNDTQTVTNLTSTAGGVVNMYAMWENASVSYVAEREGYSFAGWYLDAECTAKVTDNEYTPIQNTTLYAKWEKDYTITVDNEKEGHTYNSYQIFQGTYYEKEKKIIGENGEEKIIKVPILSNIEWSSELQKEVENGKTHGDKILELLRENEKDKLEEEKLYTDCKTAEDIAKVLQGKPNDGEVIIEFTDIVGKYILENNIPITKGTSTVVEGIDSEGKIDKNYKITHLDPGYYIVIDEKANEKNDAYSRYLIDVVQDVIMEPKTSIPRLNKKVKGNNIKTLVSGVEGESSAEYVEDEKRNTATYKKESEEYNAEDYDIEFELKSYIPDTTGYSTYKLEVVDILAKGFDYDRNSIKVMLRECEYPKTRERTIKEENSESTKVENTEEIINSENAQENGEEIIQNSESKKEIVENYTVRDVVINEENYETYKKYFEEEGKEYPEGYAESNYGKTLILVELKDLVEQVNAGIVEKGQDIFIKYKAKLNGKGEIGNTPNINEAYVKYSNDPYHNEKITQTKTEITYTYTIDLNISKIAEIKKSINNSDSENENLVQKNNNSENENLVVENNNSENGNLVEDIENSEDSQTSEQLKYLEGAEFEIYNGPEYIKGDLLLPVKNPNRKLIETIKTNEILDSEGNIINKAGQAIYSSLGAGTYYIKETKSPEGYNKLREEIVIEIKATCDEYGTIKWTVKNVENNLVFAQIGMKEIIKENVNEETGEIITEIVKTEIPEIKLRVENTSGFELPVTGGNGTIIFSAVGLSIMLIVGVSLKSNKKKVKCNKWNF